MSTPTIKLSEAISQGYTHFFMGYEGAPPESEFQIFELSKKNIEDVVSGMENEDNRWEMTINGDTPMLVAKAQYPYISIGEIADFVGERIELDDNIIPTAAEQIHAKIKDEELFIKGLGLINEALRKFPSYVDAGIKIEID